METSAPANHKSLIDQFTDALLAVNRVAALRLFQESRLGGVKFSEAVVVPALEQIGVAWEQGSAALSQVYMSGRICESLLDSSLEAQAAPPFPAPRLALAVLNDSHLLGKRLVHSVLRAAGLPPLDYGTMCAADLAARAQQDGIEILLISTLMLPSALQVKELRQCLRAYGSSCRVVVGGAPFRLAPDLWREVGADATSPTASGVVAIVKDLAGATG